MHNLLWGAHVITLPKVIFKGTGMASMRYFHVWQSVGMIIGVHEIGYLRTASGADYVAILCETRQ